MPFTASSGPRLLKCLASGVLPQNPPPSSEAAEKGHIIHGFLAEVGNIGKAEALARVPEEWRGVCEQLELEGLPLGPGYLSELSMALDLESGMARELGQSLNRNYPTLAATEVAGTADVVGVTDDAVVILDYKTGHGHVDSAASNSQLELLALMAARLYEKDHAKVSIIRLYEDGTARTDTAELDAIALDAVLMRVRSLAAQLNAAKEAAANGKTPNTSPGAWCKYCPALNSCPSQVGLIQKFAGDPLGATAETIGMLNPAQAAEAWKRLRAIKDATKLVEDALEAYASRTPIPLGGNRYVGVVESEREEVIGEVAYRELATGFGVEVAREACEIKAPKTSIKKALRKAKRAGLSLAAVEEMFFEKLRLVGGIVTKRSTRVREFAKGEQ